MAKKKKDDIVRFDATADRAKALKEAIAQITKTYGAGSIMKMGEAPALDIDVVPTGSLSVDVATGVGGVPKGRIVEIYGPESSGKTTLTLHIVAEAQKAGGKAAFIDAEHALDPVYAKNIGVDIDELYVSQPDSGEQALEIAELLISSGAFDVIIIDSVAALVPKTEIMGEFGAVQVGTQARMMSQALRRLTSIISKSGTCVIFINQLRANVGTYGGAEVTTGGRALKFYASMRIEVRKGDLLKDGSNVYGCVTKIKLAKNKLAPPFSLASYNLIYGKGINKNADILEVACNSKVVDKAGSWFSYKGERLGQGLENVAAKLEEMPELLEKIKNEVLEKLSEGKIESTGSSDEDDFSDSDDILDIDDDGVILE